ncbi:MAG: DUF6062 family protein [Clostridiales bacterium]|nr:DUF6062 family protein [Clostridiales bacterium]
MIYKIDTIPIWNAFKEPSECPICKLRKKLEDSLVSLYLNEAVMEPLYRVEVNRTGFCSEHFQQLSRGGNKCGLALQTVTRAEYLEKHLPRPGNAKAAAKAAGQIRDGLAGCVICGALKKSLDIYLETIVQLFLNEPEFPALFQNDQGFCLPHYADLLTASRCAGKKSPVFLRAVQGAFFAGLKRVKNDAENFTQKFDACKHGGGAPILTERDTTALPRLIGKLTGK